MSHSKTKHNDQEGSLDPARQNSAAAVDLDYLRDMTGDDPESVRDMVTLYLEHTGQQIAQLKESVFAGDAQAIEELAHSSKGGSLSCGMTEMASVLALMETAGREARLQETEELMQQVVQHFDTTRTYLEQHLTPQERKGVTF